MEICTSGMNAITSPHRLTYPKGVHSSRYFFQPMRTPKFNMLMHIFILPNPFVVCSCMYAFSLRIAIGTQCVSLWCTHWVPNCNLSRISICYQFRQWNHQDTFTVTYTITLCTPHAPLIIWTDSEHIPWKDCLHYAWKSVDVSVRSPMWSMYCNCFIGCEWWKLFNPSSWLFLDWYGLLT